MTQANIAQESVRTLSLGAPDAQVAQESIRTLSANWLSAANVGQVVVRTLSGRFGRVYLFNVQEV